MNGKMSHKNEDQWLVEKKELQWEVFPYYLKFNIPEFWQS